MKIPEFKRSGIGLIAEFCGIPNRIPNQVLGIQISNIVLMVDTRAH